MEAVAIEEEGLVVRVRLRRRDGSRCGVCGRRAPGYDRGGGRRRWRALDLGATKAFVEATAPRVACREHGVVVARVPWPRQGAWFTRQFEDQAAWLATYCSKSAVCELMRVSWLTVGRIVERVVADESARRGDPLAGLRRIGIDELSYRKGQRYITGVVCHETGRLVWSADGRDKKTVERFFRELGERSAQLELVSSDMGEWITRVVAEQCPTAVLCLDPFHVVALASTALDQVRREVWNEARRSGDNSGARWLKGARWALWKRPERLSERQQAKLASIAVVNRRLYRAYLLKEQLRLVFHEPDSAAAIALLDAWLSWARRCRIASFVKLAKTIKQHYQGIVATLTHRLSNARIEAVNTTLRLITRRAYGFHATDALIALAMLTVGGLRPSLPGRA